MGLVVIKGKIQIHGSSKPHTVEIGRYNCERVESFTCLGSLVTGNSNVSEEMTNCLIAANRIIFWTKKSVFTYTTETWTTTKKDERRQSISKRKIICIMYGPTCKRGQWWKRYSSELEELYNEPNIVNVIKSSKLRWAGHVV